MGTAACSWRNMPRGAVQPRLPVQVPRVNGINDLIYSGSADESKDVAEQSM